MTEVKKDKQIFTVARVFFLLIVLPLSLMAILIANGMFKLGITAKERAVTVLDQKSQEEIKIRAINVADEVANFLTERRKDLFVATILPASESAYKQFLSENKRNVWVKENDKINQVAVPLYTEMALIDKAGNEVIKISNGSVVPKSKLSKAGNDYFAKAKTLNKGEVYIAPVSGLYVNRFEFEKGQRFNGTLRLAAPIFGQEGLTGVITLALDYRHLAGFTDHIIPTQQSYVYEADAATGNYAYMVDWRGFCIAHPNDYHIEGQLADGTPVPPLTKDNYEEQIKKGQEVLDFNLLGFMDPALPEIAKQAQAGNSGIKEYKFGGHTKFVAYAPIKFSAKDIKTFGWIGMGVDVEKFNELAMATSKNIEKEAKAWSTTIILILGISIILLFLISALLARGISRSIAQEVPEGSQEVVDYYEDEEDK
ncbi:MAG: cache domain-containing protein [Syntrophaceae bacterium]